MAVAKRKNQGAGCCCTSGQTCGSCGGIPNVLNVSLVYTPLIAGCLNGTPIPLAFTITYDPSLGGGRWKNTGIAFSGAYNTTFLTCGGTPNSGTGIFIFTCVGGGSGKFITQAPAQNVAGNALVSTMGGGSAPQVLPTTCSPFSWTSSYNITFFGTAISAPYTVTITG